MEMGVEMEVEVSDVSLRDVDVKVSKTRWKMFIVWNYKSLRVFGVYLGIIVPIHSKAMYNVHLVPRSVLLLLQDHILSSKCLTSL